GDDQPKTTPESAPNNNEEETTPQAGYMPSVPGIDEAEANAAKAEDKPAKTPYKPILPPGQALKQAKAAKSASADDAPLQLADADALPSMSRVAGTFVILGLLLMALMFGLRRLQERNPNRLAFGRDSVKVLATYPIARGHSIIFIDILNEIAVLSQSPNAINILYRLDEHQVEALRKQSASSSRSSSDSFVQTLASRFIGQAPTPPDTVPIRATVDRQSPSNEATRATRDAAIGHEPRLETLDDLARSLEANARAGAARRSQELEALTEEPEPTPTSRSLRRTAAAAPPPPASRPVAVDTDLYAAIEQPPAAAGRTDHSPGYREPGPG
ncbi:MAG: flagellar biosynthetic protein FliO, partial [Myxococcota bacterium]